MIDFFKAFCQYFARKIRLIQAKPKVDLEDWFLDSVIYSNIQTEPKIHKRWTVFSGTVSIFLPTYLYSTTSYVTKCLF